MVSVRQSLLAILDQGPCYGYQLRAEFDRRTGSTWRLNVGQIYSTLDRLERDGLVIKGDTDEHGHVYYEITDAGSAEASRWLSETVDRQQGARDELAIKIALAATLPGVDVASVIDAERTAIRSHLDELDRQTQSRSEPPGAEEVARLIIADAKIFAAEAQLRWLDHSEERLAQHPEHATGLELSAERPRRGRPPQPGG